MNNSNLIADGLQLMLIGMGMVFVFLSVLVFCTKLIQRFFAEAEIEDSIETLQVADQDNEIVAITAAIHQYRRTSRSNNTSLNKEQQ